MSYRFWKKTPRAALHRRLFEALGRNLNYEDSPVLGVPASSLDDEVFHQDAAFLADAPFMSTMVANPNHIGCHTFGDSESYFAGTQAIERELIELLAVDLLHAGPETTDGYVASGGTEANLQAVWMARNRFERALGARREGIALLCSDDSHYCVDKAADVLGLRLVKVPVDPVDRGLRPEAVDRALDRAVAEGVTHVVAFANLMTTMFGSVDDPAVYTEACARRGLPLHLHVDGAFGGFYHPFTRPDGFPELDFRNPAIASYTLDAHKMARAPYGTGLFLARKGLMEYAMTPTARYVSGEDCTLIGSRSGANAVAVYMILQTHGPHGWSEKIFVLQRRTGWLVERLAERGVPHFRHADSNIVALRAEAVPAELAGRFGLVPDDHHHPAWYKIVVMDHVTIERLEAFLEALGSATGVA